MPASTSPSLTSTTARLLAARPWLAPLLGLLVLAAGTTAWWLFPPWPAGPVTVPRATRRASSRAQPFLIENLRKEPKLSALKLSWTSTLPARSTVLYRAKGQPEQQLDVEEPLGLVHEARLTGLSRDSEYEITLVSTTAAREVHRAAPFTVKLFASVAEALAKIESLFADKPILKVLFEYSHQKPDRAALKKLLADKLDPLRAPISQLRTISREFFAAPDIPAATKLSVYAALKTVEHLERLAAVKQLPLLELMNGFDWGRYGQIAVSFENPALPLPVPKVNRLVPTWKTPPYFTTPGLLPGIAVDQQVASEEGPRPLIEWRESRTENDAFEIFARGERDGQREMTFTFPLADPARIGAGELWLAHSDCSPLQFFELEVNGAPLVLRPPLVMEKHHYYCDGVNVDPALLRAGSNVVKLRLKPIPEMTEGRRTFIWYVELRTRLKAG